MDQNENSATRSWNGHGHITPTAPAIAGEFGTWTVEYVVGIAGVDDGGSVRLAFRSVSDWASPQFDYPSGPNYVTVHTSADVTLAPSFGLHGIRPWARTLTLRVHDGSLAAGERIDITLGDTTGGGPGMRAQTYPETRYRIQLQVDPFGTGEYEDVTTLGFPIIGGEAVTLDLTAPTDWVDGECGWLQIRALDRWGNPDPTYQGIVYFSGDVPEECPESFVFTKDDRGVHRFENLRYETGADRPLRVTARDDDGKFGVSNPICWKADPTPYRIYWGDLHGQSEETVGTGTIDEYFAYARDIAAIDVSAHSGNDFQITNDFYSRLHDTVERFHQPGRFVTFHGYEWSGNTPAGGDHNVYYRNGGPLRRSSHTLVHDKHDADLDCYPIERLYEVNEGRDDILITPHIGGRRANLAYHSPALEPAIEIASQWGRFEWFARDALERQLQVAFIAGSDDHSGRPGWSAPTLAHHGVRGGITAFLASDLTRDSIWDAFASRRCYGTSGSRIVVDFSVSGYPMGSAPVLSTSPRIMAFVAGTAPLETIELRRGVETIYRHEIRPDPLTTDPWRVRIAWRGARNRDRSRALDWSGDLAVHNGRIVKASNYAIDSPLEGVVDWRPDHVAWLSHTCGDWDGLILDIDGDNETILEIRTPSFARKWTLADVVDERAVWYGPLLEQQLVLKRLAMTNGSWESRFEWSDDSPGNGVNPYWLWVTQSDGEFAWSSPVYVTWDPNGAHG